jgi:hypothetical protein
MGGSRRHQYVRRSLLPSKEDTLRKLFIGGALTLVSVAGVATPAFAHDCFNPNKPAGAGVHYTITGFNADGPILQSTAQGKGAGGFVSLDPSLTGGVQAPDVHTIGNSTSHEEVGGPGSQKPDHACDSKGIDYIDACFAPG